MHVTWEVFVYFAYSEYHVYKRSDLWGKVFRLGQDRYFNNIENVLKEKPE